jgi:hypothetical protein
MEPLSMLGLASRITNLVEVTSRYLELPCKIYGEREDVRLKLRELHKELSQASTTVEEPSLWIYSICIGQRDYAERRKQDSQMNQIFCGYSSGRRFENRRERLAAFRAIAGDCNRSLKRTRQSVRHGRIASQISDADDPNRVLQHLTPKLRTTPHLYNSRIANRTRSSKLVILDTGSVGEYLVSREFFGSLKPPMKGFGNIAHPGTELLLWTNNDRQDRDELILEQLRYPMDARYETIQAAHAGTVEWIFQKSEDVAWPWDQVSQSPGSGKRLFWISGKPGSGKSTLMRRMQDSWRRHRQADSNPYREDLHFWAPSYALRRNSNWMGGSVMSGDGPATRYYEMGLPTQRERKIGLDSDLINLDVLWSFSLIFNDLARVVTNNLNVIRSLFHRLQFQSATGKRFRFGMMDFGKPVLVSLLLYASPVTATSVGTTNHSNGGMNNCASFLNELRRELEELSTVSLLLKRKSKLTPQHSFLVLPSNHSLDQFPHTPFSWAAFSPQHSRPFSTQ